MNVLARELTVAREAACRAGVVLRAHYDEGLAAPRSKADASPVTDADLASNALLVDAIRRSFPNDGLLSEETVDDGSRARAARVWLIDPMDGTRDFVARTGEFAVHVGLAIDGQAVLGVVHVPVQGATYFAVGGQGAFVEREGVVQRVRVSDLADQSRLRVAVGRQDVPPNVQRFLDHADLPVSRIGASVKLMLLASGHVDLCLWLHAREKQWDTCAPSIIVQEAGGVITDVDGADLCYGAGDVRHQRGIVASNGAAHGACLEWVRPFFLP